MPGGTTRFGLKSGAVKRYYMTAEHRSAFLHQLRDTVQSSRYKVPDADLQCQIQSWVNPFKEAQSLVGISNAPEATPMSSLT